jgi:nucleoside-diphosphate-sugar epimerase
VLGERDEALGQAWHVPSVETLSTRQFLTLAFELAGLPPKISVMGRLMMTFGGLFIPAAREMVEMLYEFEKPFIINSRKVEGVFGIHGAPLTDAIQRTLDWYRAHPQAH